MGYLHLEVKNFNNNGKSKRITYLYEDGHKNKIEIFYEFDRIIPWSENTLIDGHVFAVLLHAMGRGMGIKVHGLVSHTALRNIEELQSIWSMWLPKVYKKIEIIPDRIDTNRKVYVKERAIAAFSGGVDSVFTALRHTRILPENVRYPLSTALMVHGFDVDMYNEKGFKQLVKRVKPILDDLNLDLRIIRTNSRELRLQNWDDSHGLELAACLHMYSDEFEFGLIGSAGPYDGAIVPWGSNAVTDHLISSNNFSIIHDGGGSFRTDKVAEIIHFPLACKLLKVCYEAVDTATNCGKCEKCVRTQLNFLAAGAKSLPPCFPEGFNLQAIRDMKTYSNGIMKEFTMIIKYAKEHNVSGEWISVLEERIARWNPLSPAVLEKKKRGGYIKRSLVKLCEILSLDNTARKLWRNLYRTLRSKKLILQHNKHKKI